MNMLSISGTSASGQSLSVGRCVTMAGYATTTANSPLGSSPSPPHSTGSYVRSSADQLQDEYPQSANNSSCTDAGVNGEGGGYANGNASASVFLLFFFWLSP